MRRKIVDVDFFCGAKPIFARIAAKKGGLRSKCGIEKREKEISGKREQPGES